MTPRLDETCAENQCPAMNLFESELLLTDFLYEMNELDRLQNPGPKGNELKRQRELTIDVEPESKRLKSSETLTTTNKLQATPKATPRKRRSTSWLRRKQELQALRSESEALQTHIVFLQMQQTQKVHQSRSTKITEDQEMWKSVAAIARRECKAAQAENGRLKNELQMYAQASQKLQAQLIHANARQQHWMDGTFAFVNAIRVGMIMSRHLQLENTRIFDSLESKVNERFHEVDTIVREALRPLQQGATEHVQICRGHDLDAAAAVEFKHARLLPFERDSTASTLWEIIALGGLLTDHEVHVASRSSDTVRMASRFTVPLDRAHSSLVSVDVHAVAKRFPSAIGMVVMMESRSEWSIHYSSAPTWKQTTEETGWVVVNEYPLQVYGDSQRACQLRTAMKLRPNTSDGDGSNTCSGITGCVGDIVIPSFREILSSHHQSVENFLLDSSKTTT